jgi:hypothetical protein
LDFARWGFLGRWVIPLATSRLLGRVEGVFLWLCMRQGRSQCVWWH